MSRLIDADRLLGRCKFYSLPNGDIAVPIIDIEHAPTVTPEPHWILCSDRLPEVGREILFCDIDRDIFVGHRATEHWWSVDDKVKNVIAWMPLPEPYNEETK